MINYKTKKLILNMITKATIIRTFILFFRNSIVCDPKNKKKIPLTASATDLLEYHTLYNN